MDKTKRIALVALAAVETVAFGAAGVACATDSPVAHAICALTIVSCAFGATAAVTAYCGRGGIDE